MSTAASADTQGSLWEVFVQEEGGAAHVHAGFFTPAQLVSAGILAAGLILFALLRSQQKPARA